MGKRNWLGLAGLTFVAGCGGGGGVNSTGTPSTADTTTPVVSTPTPVSPTPTTPVTTPVTINYNDAEYARSNAASYAGAITAYNAGATGAGVKIAILDSGVAAVGSEFAGRIDPASRDFGGSGTYVDADGHGTAVAAVAAAARDGSNIEGVAFNATILALRTDTAGSCSTSGGCDFSTNTLATALDYARTNGAKVVNMSLGGAASTPALTAAIDRATAAGMIVVIAAGNDGTVQPDPLAQVAANAAARGLVIIAGAHDSTGALSTFSGKAGSYGRYYLAALGSSVRSFDNIGTPYLYSGTSFSTPTIVGAVALLEQAFPNLTPAQVVALLYSSATDAGVAGVDAIFGNGLLNITRAFRPIGTTSLAGSAVAVSDADASLLSGAMGDAALHGASLGRAVVLDSLGRAFDMDLAARVAQAGVTRPLGQVIGGNLQSGGSSAGGFAFSTTIARGQVGEPFAGLAQRGRGYHPDDWAQPVEGVATARIDARTSAGFAYATGGRALGDRLDGDGAPGSFLVASAPGETPGFVTRQAASMAVRHRLGAFAITATAERGAVALPRAFGETAPGYTIATIAGERRFGALRLKAGVGALDETGTLLGARLTPAFGQAGATTRFADLAAGLVLGDGWQADARWRQGWTEGRRAGALTSAALTSRSAAFDIGRQGRRLRFGLRLALPPRVTSGGLDLALPTSYDYTTGAIGYSEARFGLVPEGHERDLEANAGLRVGTGWLESNLFVRRQPGNIAALSDDLGGAVRFSLAF